MLGDGARRRVISTHPRVGDCWYAELKERGGQMSINGSGGTRLRVEVIVVRLLAPGRCGKVDYEEGSWLSLPLTNRVLRDAIADAEPGWKIAYHHRGSHDWICAVEPPDGHPERERAAARASATDF
jgi:hypothetical protein